MQLHTESPALENALIDPASWADEAGIHEQFRWLRAHDPIRRMHPEGFEPFWSITKHHHIKAIEGEKKLFINDPRPILGPIHVQMFVEAVTGRKHLVRSLVQMDDPDHSRYRRLTQSWFLGNNLRSLQVRVDALARAYVDRLESFGGECDFVKDVAVWYPLRVIMTILGIPESDEPLMLKLTQEMFGSGDPDTQRSFELDDFVQVVRDFEDYFAALAKEKRKRPTDDVASVIAGAKVDGKHLPPLDLAGYYTIIAAAGHDTTSSSLAGGLLALIEHPAEMQKLRGDVDGMMDTAVDEAIRWVTPVRQFARTATGLQARHSTCSPSLSAASRPCRSAMRCTNLSLSTKRELGLHLKIAAYANFAALVHEFHRCEHTARRCGKQRTAGALVHDGHHIDDSCDAGEQAIAYLALARQSVLNESFDMLARTLHRRAVRRVIDGIIALKQQHQALHVVGHAPVRRRNHRC